MKLGSWVEPLGSQAGWGPQQGEAGSTLPEHTNLPLDSLSLCLDFDATNLFFLFPGLSPPATSPTPGSHLSYAIPCICPVGSVISPLLLAGPEAVCASVCPSAQWVLDPHDDFCGPVGFRLCGLWTS